MPGPTITVRSEGGVVSDLDVPDEGTVQRELFDDHLAKGRYVVLSDWPPAEDKPKRTRKPKATEPPAEDAPEGSDPADDEGADSEGGEA
jgi:hypothetical protein